MNAKQLSPQDVALIVSWARKQEPEPNIQLTNYEPETGADGILVEFDELNVRQAVDLFEIRRLACCHVSIGNTQNIDQVVFNKLFPTLDGKPIEY